MAERNGLVVLKKWGTFRPPPPPGKYIDYIQSIQSIDSKHMKMEEKGGSSSGEVKEVAGGAKKRRKSSSSSCTTYCEKGNGSKLDNNDENNTNSNNDVTFQEQRKQSLPLLDTMIFQSKNEDFQSRYQYRRHQSGRSFASRRAEGGSETITFGRKADVGFYSTMELPWQTLPSNCFEGGGSGNDNGNGNGDGCGEGQAKNQFKFKCSQCDKSFRDERARKNHIKCVHQNSNGSSNNKKSQTNSAPLTCDLCKKEGLCTSICSRIFPHVEALEAHKKAKHTGLHTTIRPDWAGKTKKESCICVDVDENVATSSNFDCGFCETCGMAYENMQDKVQHFRDFVPKKISDNEKVHFRCMQCGKTFRDERAQLQHKNFCSINGLGDVENDV